ncbi:MAG: DUF3307 domain-containing protein [Bdellovibrionales bacterium]|nr:DUF3307 domain-containing protein [Bdellovibrionales bacterium]
MMSGVEMGSLSSVFLLLVLFQLKHFIADYPLQREYMLKKGLPGWDFVKPLSLHCFVHALGTGLIVVWINPHFIWLIFVDFSSHFIMDRIKSGPKYLGRFRDKNTAVYWNCFGLDQMVHHLTNYFMIWLLITHTS